MLTRHGRRVMEIALVLCAMGSITACAPTSRSSSTSPRVEYPLLVNNQTDFEVVVYAMASPSSRGMRLGSARPFAKTVLNVPGNALQSSDVFSVQLHAIGAARTTPNWISQTTVLSDNLVAQLDVHGDMAGNLRMSMLSSRLAKSYK